MPSLKMKPDPAPGFLKEKSGLHVRKSSMISKTPLSRARVCQNAEEVCTTPNQDASLPLKVCSPGVGGDGRPQDESHVENIFQKYEATLTDSIAADSSKEHALSNCTSDIPTMFSPMLEAMEYYDDNGIDHFYVPQLDSEDSDDSSKSSTKHHACNVSDFNISDLIFSVAPLGSGSGFDSKTDAAFLLDYKYEEPNLLCDLTDESTILPLLDDTLDIGCDLSDRHPEGNITDADNSSLYMAIHQLRSHSQDSHINYLNQDQESFDPQMYIRNLPDQLDIANMLSPTPVQWEKRNTKQITLVLDLDETLVHSTLDPCEDADFTFPVFFNTKDHTVYVKKRPHLHTFLERVAKMFEVVVFTASQSIYAGKLLDILDPDGKVISKRAYRESCILSEGIYTKDLTILGVDLAKVAIIDNSPQVFRWQVNNGIPIKSWFNDQSDSALISLLPFLETLVDAVDVRPIIARKFGNKE